MVASVSLTVGGNVGVLVGLCGWDLVGCTVRLSQAVEVDVEFVTASGLGRVRPAASR